MEHKCERFVMLLRADQWGKCGGSLQHGRGNKGLARNNILQCFLITYFPRKNAVKK
jgi:hypothetical protein